jgi:hypothetical protein
MIGVLYSRVVPGTPSTRVRTGTIVTSVPARKGWAFGVLVNTNALWVGAHYSAATKRWCINVLPCLTVWFTKRGGDAPVRSKL